MSEIDQTINYLNYKQVELKDQMDSQKSKYVESERIRKLLEEENNALKEEKAEIQSSLQGIIDGLHLEKEMLESYKQKNESLIKELNNDLENAKLQNN